VNATLSDHEAMDATKLGDAAAFEQIVRRHQGSLINYFYKFTGNFEQSRELTQDVFLRVFQSANRYKPVAKFTTYLFTIAHNLAINEVIAKKRNEEEFIDDRIPNGYFPFSDKTPEDAILVKEIQTEVRHALFRLTSRERSAIIMKYTEGMTYDEIAGATGSSESAVESLIMRARAKLKLSLKKTAEKSAFSHKKINTK